MLPERAARDPPMGAHRGATSPTREEVPGSPAPAADSRCPSPPPHRDDAGPARSAQSASGAAPGWVLAGAPSSPRDQTRERGIYPLVSADLGSDRRRNSQPGGR